MKELSDSMGSHMVSIFLSFIPGQRSAEIQEAHRPEVEYYQAAPSDNKYMSGPDGDGCKIGEQTFHQLGTDSTYTMRPDFHRLTQREREVRYSKCNLQRCKRVRQKDHLIKGLFNKRCRRASPSQCCFFTRSPTSPFYNNFCFIRTSATL